MCDFVIFFQLVFHKIKTTTQSPGVKLTFKILQMLRKINTIYLLLLLGKRKCKLVGKNRLRPSALGHHG